MSWILAIGLALAAFAVALFVLGAARKMWSILAASLALGLAGYSMQASPGLPGAPVVPAEIGSSNGWALVDARRELLATRERSDSDKVLIADAMTRNGRHEIASALLRSAANDDPRDAEAWLALGNVLVEHAGGRLTKPALIAYRRAAVANPQSVAPGYFLGLALIRQGSLGQGRNLWQEVLENVPDDAFAREIVAERLARLDGLLVQMAPSPIPVPAPVPAQGGE